VICSNCASLAANSCPPSALRLRGGHRACNFDFRAHFHAFTLSNQRSTAVGTAAPAGRKKGLAKIEGATAFRLRPIHMAAPSLSRRGSCILRFHTRSGLLTADRRGDWIELDFPAKIAAACEPPAELLPALGIASAKFSGKNAFDYFVEIESDAELRGLQPDHSRLGKLPVRGVIVTARSGSPEYDFVSRFFAPGSGIDEDPVTGSAHTALGPYWANLLSKNEMIAYQASARGGVVRVAMKDDRVLLGGQAVTVMTADLLV